MIRIVTDTGSDITYLRAESLGMEIVELNIIFDEFEYDYRNDPDFSVFYKNLIKSKGLPRTSQVNPAQYLEIFNDAKEKGDEVFVLTLSGGLSGTYSSAKMAREECGYEPITIVDTRHAIMGQRSLAEYAVSLRDAGKSRGEIENAVLEIRDRMCLIACLDSLTYLKKGGRVPPALALIGNAIKMKPVVTLADGKVEPLAKVRGFQAGMQALWDKLEKDGIDDTVIPFCFGHTDNEERGRAFMEETIKKFGIKNHRFYPVGGVIGTHTGPNCLIVTYSKIN
jgi:DegV family protein with EDD domain